MKNLICYLFHERSRGRWEKWFCHSYVSTCEKCGRHRFTQAPGLWEWYRSSIVVLICFVVLAFIGYLLKYKL